MPTQQVTAFNCPNTEECHAWKWPSAEVSFHSGAVLHNSQRPQPYSVSREQCPQVHTGPMALRERCYQQDYMKWVLNYASGTFCSFTMLPCLPFTWTVMSRSEMGPSWNSICGESQDQHGLGINNLTPSSILQTNELSPQRTGWQIKVTLRW